MIEPLVMTLALIGAFLNAQKKIEGFYFWIVANSIGAWMFFETSMYYMGALYVVFAANCIYGIGQWRKVS